MSAVAEENLAQIVLIEDDEIDKSAVIRAMKRCGINNPLSTFTYGQDALSYLERLSEVEKTAAIVLLDLNLPRMDGITILETMRNHPKLKHISVFVLTTSQSHEDIKRAYSHQVSGYILKSKLDEEFNLLAKFLNLYTQNVSLPEIN